MRVVAGGVGININNYNSGQTAFVDQQVSSQWCDVIWSGLTIFFPQETMKGGSDEMMWEIWDDGEQSDNDGHFSKYTLQCISQTHNPLHRLHFSSSRLSASLFLSNSSISRFYYSSSSHLTAAHWVCMFSGMTDRGISIVVVCSVSHRSDGQHFTVVQLLTSQSFSIKQIKFHHSRLPRPTNQG